MIRPVFNERWSEEVKSLYAHDMQQYWDRKLVPNEWNQYQSLLGFYLSLVTGESALKILDVGCAQATLAILLAERGHDVTALDIRKEFLDYAESRYETGAIEFYHGNVLDLQINEKFDLIFANQIVEHLTYPQEMVESLRSLLNPGGKLVVTTPNWKYLTNALPSFEELGDPQLWSDLQFSADGDGHFFAYSRNELTKIFSHSGFTHINSCFHETPVISGHLKFRYLHRFLPYRLLRFIDQILLKVPILREYIAHQLMVVGVK